MKQGWEIKKLGEVCDFISGFSFKSTKFTDKGESILRISDIQNGSVVEENMKHFDINAYKEDLSRFIVKPNDILIAMSGGTTGKIGVNKTDKIFYLNQRVGLFREHKNKLDHNYLFYYLNTKCEESLRIAAGAAQPNLSAEQIKNFSIPVPPLDEQKEIVKKLDSISEKVRKVEENYKKVLEECDKLKQATLKNIFE